MYQVYNSITPVNDFSPSYYMMFQNKLNNNRYSSKAIETNFPCSLCIFCAFGVIEFFPPKFFFFLTKEDFMLALEFTALSHFKPQEKHGEKITPVVILRTLSRRINIFLFFYSRILRIIVTYKGQIINLRFNFHPQYSSPYPFPKGLYSVLSLKTNYKIMETQKYIIIY